jgi:hypothetical protein
MIPFISLYRGGCSVVVDGNGDIRRCRSARVVIIQIIWLAVLCSLEAFRRNWTKSRHGGVTHDIWMERVPLDVPYGGRRCEYDDINVHDVVMLETPWLCAVVDGSTLSFGSLKLNHM